MTTSADGPEAGIDVALVCMPDAATYRPSLALGQLKAVLTRGGLRSKVYYPNLMYLDYVGAESHGIFGCVRTEDRVIDWIFGRAAFPDFEPDHARYLARLWDRNALLHRHDREALEQRLRQLRDSAPGFIDWATDKVLSAGPRIVGATSTFQQHVAALALLREVKRRRPDVVTMMGGANCETVMGRTTHAAFPWVDYVVSGEADGFFDTLCADILRHGTDVPAEALPIGAFGPRHRTDGYPRIEGGDGLPRATTSDMSTVPAPDYDDFFEALDDCLYRDGMRPGLPFETSRGCWWGAKQHCTFCGLNGGGMAFRAKPPDQALEEMDGLVARYGVHDLEAVDNIIDTGYLDSLLPAIAGSDRAYNIFYETKANLKPAQVRMLAASGVRYIQPGIESLHSGVLQLMRKGVKAWNNVRLLRLCRQHGIRVAWSILTGFPGEDDAWYLEMAERLPLISHLQPGGCVDLRYDRYSPYFNDPQQYGIDLVPSELYQFVYPLPPDQLADLAYFFEQEGSVDPVRSLLHGGRAKAPGVEAVRVAVNDWRTAWTERDNRPVLLMREEDDALVIDDTRDCAVAGTHRLYGITRRVLEACDDAPPRHRVASLEPLQEAAPEAVEEALRELADRRLVMEIDDRVIALPLRAPLPDIPCFSQFPGGFSKLPRRALKARPAALAAE